MPIRPLSELTSRVITSAQTLTNATSVVKELVENAFDARASSISIEIAANTLDRIVVKDDGSGVGVEDRQLLCKRGCTSKIEDLDDLARLGGTYLGFRGTALASIAELSKEVTIITKLDGEQTGTTMTFGPAGKLLSSASASHNTGTTIRVENFLASIPVRRQVVLKNSSKILDEIKKLLRAYALARPTVKIVLKVLKSKIDKANWSFAACKDSNQLMAAATQLVGKAVTGVCRMYTEISDGQQGSDLYQVHALLLNASDKQMSKTGNPGQYLSIDGRPVSQEKGLIKEIVKKYKTYLEQACLKHIVCPVKPFLIMHLYCPIGSYDVNVEPAKDVVLFHHPDKVLELVEKVFVTAYGELQDHEVMSVRESVTSTSKRNVSSFDILLARKKIDVDTRVELDKVDNNTSAATVSSPDKNAALSNELLIESYAEAMEHTSPPSRFSMFDSDVRDDSTMTPPCDRVSSAALDLGFDESVTHTTDDDETPDIEEYDPNDVTINNPFVQAKLSSLSRLKNKIANNNIEHNKDKSDLTQTPQGPSSYIETPRNSHRRPLNTIYCPPTPDPSPLSITSIPYQNPGPPLPRRSRQTDEEVYEAEPHVQNRLDTAERNNQLLLQEQLRLTNWIRPPVHTSQSLGSPSVNSQVETQLEPHSMLFNQTSHTRPVDDAQLKNPVFTNKPIQSPLKTCHSTVLPVNIYKNSLTKSDSMSSAMNAHVPSSVSHMLDDDLQHILEFEQRKKIVNQQRKMNQTALNPAELFRTQQKSSDFLPASRLPENHGYPRANSNNMPSKFTLSLGGASVISSPKASNFNSPHKNRYLAAKRHLQNDSVPTVHTAPAVDVNKSRLVPDDQVISNEHESVCSLPVSDTRGYLISHRRLDYSRSSNPKTRRVKSSLLPFEKIPPEAIKHNILCTPSNGFPPIDDLSTICTNLSPYNSYITNGGIEAMTWSPLSKDTEQWQEALETLVNTKYRAIIDTSSGSGSEDARNLHIKIPLARLLQAHIDST